MVKEKKASYNLEKLVAVKLYDFIASQWYTYEKRQSLLGFTLRKEGFYYRFITKGYKGLDVPKNHFLKGGVVYEAPEVRMFFQGRAILSKYFETFEKAKEFFEIISKGNNWINKE